MFGKDLEAFKPTVDIDGMNAETCEHYGILASADIINHSGQALSIDGVNFIFQYIPKTEVAAKITFYLPDLNAFGGADIALPKA